MANPKQSSKKIGKYAIYKWEHFDGAYNYRTDRIDKDYVYTEVAVFISGKQKSLQRSKDYKTKSEGQRAYNKLSSIKAIEKWINQ